MKRQRWRAPIVVLFAVVALLFSSPVAVAEPTPTPSPGPLQISPANARANMIAFSWTAVPGAAGYRVQVKTAPGGAPLRELVINRTAVVLSGLKANTSYWAQVIALDAGSLPIGNPSPELQVDTPYPLAAPLVQANVRSSISLDLTWLKPPKGVKLQLEWKAPGRKPKLTTPKGTRLVKDDLRQGTKYTVRARLIRGKVQQSSWSKLAVETPEGDPLRVAGYNIQCANCRAWGPRRSEVAKTIIDAELDVVGLQEASAAELKRSNRNQFEDVAALLAPAGYKLTNLTRYNCRRSNTPKKCRHVYRGASGSVRIAYNTATVKLISQGSRQLADLRGTGSDRYIAWAVFEHRINGKRFLFSSTHLEHRNDSGGSRRFYNIRRQQAQLVARTIKQHADGLPVIAVGDYNSTKWDTPSNAPYDIMHGAGFVDPLGNSYRSTTSAKGATVEKRINTQYSSYNGLQQRARRSAGVNGSNLDYIFVTPMRVLDYETVVSVNSAGMFTSTPPSDHNLIRATVLLP